MTGIAPAFARAASSLHEASRAAPPRWMHDRRYQRSIAAMVWLLMVLMVVPEGFDYSSLTSGIAPTSGDIGSRLLWLVLLAGGGLVLILRLRLARMLGHWLNPFLLAFVLLVAASIAWSFDPPVTARRLIRVVTIVLCATAFVLMGWHARRFQNVMRPLLTLLLLASILFGLGWPTLAIHQETEGVLLNAWHGLANHKNGLGDIASIGLIFWFHAWLSRETSSVAALAGGSIAIACLLLSKSSTSMVASVFTLAMMTMLLRPPPGLRRYVPYLVALFVVTLLGYSLAVLDIIPGLGLILSPIGAITGKDMSFTGRTDIWEIVNAHIRLSPWLGSGYGAYWTGIQEGSPAYEMIVQLGFYPASSHNGYLEVLNDLGALGLLLLFGYLGSYVAQSLRLLLWHRTQACLYLALFLQQAIVNLSESRWLSSLSVDFVIMTLATAALARGLLEIQLQGALRASRQATATTAPPVPDIASITNQGGHAQR